MRSRWPSRRRRRGCFCGGGHGAAALRSGLCGPTLSCQIATSDSSADPTGVRHQSKSGRARRPKDQVFNPVQVALRTSANIAGTADEGQALSDTTFKNLVEGPVSPSICRLNLVPTSYDATKHAETNMFIPRFSIVRLLTPLSIALAVSVAIALQSTRHSSGTHLQDLADAAALAGMSSLAGSAGLPDSDRRAASIAAAARVVAVHQETASDISPSQDGSSVSVTIRDIASDRHASATARYIAPTGESPTRQSSNKWVRSPASGTM